ncbi:uncharacterized protein LOC143375485 [Andrena cerasifolii]|uniref:uncharacterized protein LOC143375485 n=1 Tax=Andrena cerasifolii TaxID=2819439 RepID=UPI004037F969
MLEDQHSTNYSLISAVREGRVKTVRKILKSFSLSYSQAWSDGYVLLRDALENRHTKVAKLLLIKGCKVNSKNNNISHTPLHFAVINGDIEIIQMLLSRGAKINAISPYGDTPLHDAVLSNKIEIIKLLINQGADVNAGDNKDMTPLHVAIENDSEEIVELLLRRSANIHPEGQYGTPLHLAVERGYLQIVDHLIKYGACVNSTGTSVYSEDTPLQLAARREHNEVVKLLLERGANVDVQSEGGDTILHCAAENGDSALIEHILKHGPDVNNKSNKSALNAAVLGCGRQYFRIVKSLLEYGFTVDPEVGNDCNLLHAAVEKGYLTIVEQLLKYGSDVNISISSTSPLHVAIRKKQEEIAKPLISYGADLNSRDKAGNTPIFYAAKNGDLEMVRLLLTNKANVKDSPQVLNTAVQQNRRDIVEVLLQHGADVNASTKYGVTALHYTVLNKNGTLSRSFPDNDDTKGEIARLLLSRGANVNAQTQNGIMTLHAATRKGFVRVVDALLEYDADVNCAYENEKMPLYYSAEKGQKVITKMLLDKGANVNAKQEDGRTALHIAIQRGHKRVVQLLLKYGSRVDSVTKNRATPLHSAARNGYVDIVKVLLKLGADIDFKDNCGETALHVASHAGKVEVVTILLDHGSDITITNRNSRTALGMAEACIRLFRFTDHSEDSDSDHYDQKSGYGYAHVKITQILKRHMVKLKTANLYARNQKLLSIINDDEDLSDFQDECEEEIASMKSEMIGNSSISFYNILTKGISQLAIYAGNESVAQALRSDDYEIKFPIYASTINTHFRDGERRKELLEQGNTTFHSFFNFLGLPRICAERIFNYLSDDDLRTLMDACKCISISSTNTDINNVIIV